jgi:hypothetical protein
MIAFGLFLLLAVGIVAGFAVAAGDDPAVLNLVGFEVDTTDRGLIATGALCALGLLIALRVVAMGVRRARRRRRELKELRSSVGQTTTSPSERDADHSRRGRWSDFDDDWDERDSFESTPHD